MIIYKCDICHKKVEEIESIVLYKKRIDYCKDCAIIANRAKKQMERNREYYNEQLDKRLKESEKLILKNIKEEK